MNPTQTLKLLFIIIGIFFFVACSDSSASKNCSLYKEGTFSYHYKNGEKVFHVTFTRKGPDQTEKSEEDGYIDKYKILWTDSCSYDLIFIEGSENQPKDLLNYKRKNVVHTTILSGTNKYYLFKSTSDLNDRVIQDTIWLAR